ncbi:MAG: hypothetical protein CR988_02345 [Treponema sp.]|nr:MAG: hypothetical protein CR988_02345 [Treponema sp.]
MRYNKFNISPKKDRTVDGIPFASKAEMKRYNYLKMLEKAGEITSLELQPKFLLIPKTEKERACWYVADFKYKDKTGAEIIEDVKGVRTPVFKIKKKLLLYKYPDINFREIKV